MVSEKVSNTPSPLPGEDRGEGYGLSNFSMLSIPLLLLPSRQGRRDFTLYEFIKGDDLVKTPKFLIFSFPLAWE
jgi:hypothetical protein